MVGESILDFFDSFSQRKRVWSLVAERFGGTYRPARGGFFNRSKPEIDAEIGNVAVNVTLLTEGAGDSSTTYTLVRAGWLLGSGPELRVTSANVLTRMGRALGLQDVPTGDPAFDDAFIVKAPVADAVHALLDQRARRAMSSLRTGRLNASASSVEYRVSRIMADPTMFAIAMELVAQVAAMGSAHVALLQQLPGQFTHAHGPWNSRTAPWVVMEIGASRVSVMAVTFPWSIQFVLRTELRRDVPELRLVIENGKPHADPPDGLFDPESFGILTSLGNSTLRITMGVAQLELHGPADIQRVQRAGRWLARFAEGRPRGAFR